MDRASQLTVLLVVVPMLVSGAIAVWTVAVNNREQARREERADRVADVDETRRVLGRTGEALQAALRGDGALAQGLMEKTEGAIEWELMGRDLALRWWKAYHDVKEAALGSKSLDHAAGISFQTLITETHFRLREVRADARKGRIDTHGFWDDPEIQAAGKRMHEEGFELSASAREHSSS
jgi:hypothetical protein